MNQNRRRARLDQGFTLIERLVVVIIIGILAAIAIPVFLNQRQKGWDAAVKSDLKNAATAEHTYLAEAGTYTADVGILQVSGFKYSTGSNYSGGTAVIDAQPDAGRGFCLEARSASGAIWSYATVSGGLQSENVTC